MSTLAVDAIVDSNNGNTTTINGATPTAYNTMGKNLIINGAMQVAQRGTSVTGITSNTYNTADRFINIFTGGGYDQAVVSDAPDGFSKSLKITTSTADATLDAGDRLNIAQKIEGQNVQHLNFGSSAAKEFTVSFWVKSSVTGVYALEIYQYADGSHFTKNYTISSANTWEYKTITYTANTGTAVPDDNGLGISIWFWLRAGSDYNSGAASNTWNTTNSQRAIGQTADVGAVLNSTFQITGVQLEVGSVATEFERRPYGTELALCQRYYYQQNWTDSYQQILDPCRVGATNQLSAQFKLPVTMRTRPSFSHNGAGNFRVNHTNSGGTINDEVCNQIQVNSTTTDAISLNFYKPTANMTRGDTGYVNCEGANDASIYVSAEL